MSCSVLACRTWICAPRVRAAAMQIPKQPTATSVIHSPPVDSLPPAISNVGSWRGTQTKPGSWY